MLINRDTNTGVHIRVLLDGVEEYVVPVISDLFRQFQSQRLKHRCTSEEQFEEMDFLLAAFESFDPHFCEIDHGDSSFSSPFPIILLTRTPFFARPPRPCHLHLEQNVPYNVNVIITL